MKNIYTSGTKFLDKSGRERIFNGINFVDKGTTPNTTENTPAFPHWNDTEFNWCKEQGFNLIRFGITWNTLEPEIGVYSEPYLNWIESILDLCQKHDIFVFLDMHQDLYSCLYGNGAPKWATLVDDLPHVGGALWSDAYLFSPAVKRAFENFWANKPVSDGIGVQDHYINMWIHIINRFKDHPALLGYDFLNEPFPGDCGLDILGILLKTYAELTHKDMSLEELVESFSDSTKKHQFLLELEDKSLFLQMLQSAEPLVKAFDIVQLQRFYEKITHAIRKVTKHGIVLMENCYFSNLGIPCNLSPILDEQGNPDTLQAYAPHGYDLVVDTPDVTYISDTRLDVIFDTHRQVQERLDVPIIIGEWGAHYMHKEGLEHIAYLLEKFDTYKWSHTYWCYEENIKNAPAMALLNRPYPQAICGEIISYCYNRETDTFTLIWDEQLDKGTESIIYLHKKPNQILFEGIFEKKTINPSAQGLLLIIPNKGLGERTMHIYF